MTKEGAGLKYAASMMLTAIDHIEYEANYITKDGAGLKYAASMMLTAIDHIEYEANYMTKDGAGLKYATSMMLTAIDHIARYRSVTPDTGYLRRTGTHLATHCQAFVRGGTNGHCA